MLKLDGALCISIYIKPRPMSSYLGLSLSVENSHEIRIYPSAHNL